MNKNQHLYTGWSSEKLENLGFLGRGKSKNRPRNDPSLYGGKYPFIQTGEVKEADLYITKYQQTYSEKGLAQSKLWKSGTLLLTIAANVAETAILKIDACFPDSIVGFIPDSKLSDVRFIKYYIDTIKVQMQSISRGTTQDNLSLEKIRSFDFNIPPLPTQKKIAGILSAYDDLIENNSRRIEILEEMARMLYREWFVMFRFPRDGADEGTDGAAIASNNPTKITPNNPEEITLVKSELGLIPEGWEVKAIKDLPIKIIDGDRSKNYPKSHEFIDEGVLFLSTKNISDSKIDLSNNNFISEEKFLSIKKGRVIPLDIIMTTRGSIGKVALFNCSFTKALINAQMLILRSESENLNQLYLFYLMSDLGFQNLLKSFASGSAQPQIPIQDLKQINILYPAPEIQNKFSSIVRSNIEQIKNLQEKNINLRKTRDLLLPRLISGEIDVEDLDINTGEIDF